MKENRFESQRFYQLPLPEPMAPSEATLKRINKEVGASRRWAALSALGLFSMGTCAGYVCLSSGLLSFPK